MARPVTSQPMARHKTIAEWRIDGPPDDQRVERKRVERNNTENDCCGCCLIYTPDTYGSNVYNREKTARKNYKYNSNAYQRVTRNVDYGFDPYVDDEFNPNIEYIEMEDGYHPSTEDSNNTCNNYESEQVCTNENNVVSESCYTQDDYSSNVCTSDNVDNTTYDCSDNNDGGGYDG